MTFKPKTRGWLDKLYLVYFIQHIPPTLLIDLSPLYPDALTPPWMKDLRSWYVTTYKDPLIGSQSYPGGWFTAFLAYEALFQLPFFFYAAFELWKGAKDVYLPLLIYGIHVTTTTSACLGELLSFKDHILAMPEKATLLAFYLPYILIPILMSWDMWGRIKEGLRGASNSRKKHA
ncbi:hypothetical protein SAICODRAFT_29042 [Saitoella complicata NRRL Y-17804]|uniref:uncharacterized protein n=1 Tax=Saitoella complicata (strain BCRC 22490 / CBS 7301 / JCM 7358 / NBRC 10748 / NRRL Y-17804) TaxID=698492 RepID=UPI0008670AEC|nr:uncharacterized protein SAICODRAFT_29042 [Saitoella complicata NRRL Y-17804]ODQ55452.1 hypothetical protein SAICODRAFT_29042 [Saitoella complicata NRRL Y-17804]